MFSITWTVCTRENNPECIEDLFRPGLLRSQLNRIQKVHMILDVRYSQCGSGIIGTRKLLLATTSKIFIRVCPLQFLLKWKPNKLKTFHIVCDLPFLSKLKHVQTLTYILWTVWLRLFYATQKLQSLAKRKFKVETWG